MPNALRRIHSVYLGQKVFPTEMSDFEIREFFSLSSADKRPQGKIRQFLGLSRSSSLACEPS